jgi:hypothetical protein
MTSGTCVVGASAQYTGELDGGDWKRYDERYLSTTRAMPAPDVLIAFRTLSVSQCAATVLQLDDPPVVKATPRSESL